MDALLDSEILRVRHVLIADLFLDADRLGDERVAFPVPDRIAKESRLDIVDAFSAGRAGCAGPA